MPVENLSTGKKLPVEFFLYVKNENLICNTFMTTNQSLFCLRLFNLNFNKIYMKMTARNDKFAIKSQSKPDFANRKYGHWR